MCACVCSSACVAARGQEVLKCVPFMKTFLVNMFIRFHQCMSPKRVHVYLTSIVIFFEIFLTINMIYLINNHGKTKFVGQLRQISFAERKMESTELEGNND